MWEEEGGSLCEVGQQGGGASVGEAQGCVLKWITLLRGVPLVSQAENQKVGVKSESAPPATRHSQQLSSTAPGFLSVSLFCSLTHLLSFTLTHTHTHKHTHTNRHSWLKEDGTTGELLNTFTATHPAHQQSQCPGCGRLSWGSCWDYWPPPGQKFKVRRLCLFPVDFTLYGDLFFLFCLNCTGLSGSRNFWKDFNQTLLLLCGKRHHLKERDSALLLVECMCRCRRDSVSNTSTDSLAVRDSW